MRPLVGLCALGVVLRLALLWIVGDLDLQSDEANYVYLGIAWNHFGFYLDQHRYLWPPGYSWLMSHAISAFGVGGMLAVKYLQVLASASIGLTTMLFAGRLFGQRAAQWAGILWIVYLPLAAFTHLLWNETLFTALFLPGLYQLLMLMLKRADPAATYRVVIAALCFTGSLYLKESPQFLVLVFALLLVPFAGGVLEGLRRGSLLVLVLAACVTPWGLHNKEVYGHFIPLGASLGENVFNGLNQDYRNFDLIPIDVERERRGLEGLKSIMRRWFTLVEPIRFSELDGRIEDLKSESQAVHAANVKAMAEGAESDPRDYELKEKLRRNLIQQERRGNAEVQAKPDDWIEFSGNSGWLRAEPPELINMVDRSKANQENGLAFVKNHKGWYLRSRLRKLADFMTPMSFFTRHQALGHYDDTPIGGSVMRKLTSLWAMGCSMAILILGITGFFTVLKQRPAWILLGTTMGYFLCTTLVVAMSRFRIPAMPLLIALAAGLLTSGPFDAKQRRVLTIVSLSLGFLWWLIWPDNYAIFTEMIWPRYEP